MILRRLAGALAKSKKSLLLLGPRQTGKSTLIRSLSPDLTINLAHESTYLEFARNPNELEERLGAGRYKTVFIDEVQRLPRLLNSVQVILDEPRPSVRFYLTGSSARKLRRGRANLLPGRIHTYFLNPLVSNELSYRMDTREALSTGTLPGIWTEEDREERRKTLESYAATYLKEEIQAESLTRNVEGFSRFLFAVAAESGKFLDLSKVASQAGVPRQSAVRYFEILEDTLIIRRCETFSKSLRRRLIQSPKYFFFDAGVLNGLLGNFTVSADRIGVLFEHLIYNQIVGSAEACDRRLKISSYRTEHGADVDLIVELDGKVIAIEVKASANVGRSDLRGLRSFADFYRRRHTSMVLYLGSVRKVLDGTLVFPWQSFLQEIGL